MNRSWDTLRLGAIVLLLSLPLGSAFATDGTEQRNDAMLSSNSDPLALVAEAGRAYANGDFARSVMYYETVLKSGVVNGEVLFNLGNSYFRLKRLGPALTAFKGAARFLPRDGDIAANLEYARKQRVDALEQRPSVFQVAFAWISWGNRREFWALASLVLFAASATTLTARLLKRVLPTTATVFVWSCALITMVVASLKQVGFNEPAEAVVAQAEVSVLSGPGENNVQLFTLHEGAEVELLERREGWARTMLPDGRSGWIRGDALMTVLTDKL